jgi:multidrug efflux system outer membrane protein
MTKSLLTPLALAGVVFIAGCATLVPQLPEANPALPASWPLPPTTNAAADVANATDDVAAIAAADIGWRDFFTDPKLEELIAVALNNNRDLRVAALNVERARAQYRVRWASPAPAPASAAIARRRSRATASMRASRSSNSICSDAYAISAKRPCSNTWPRKRRGAARSSH